MLKRSTATTTRDLLTETDVADWPSPVTESASGHQLVQARFTDSKIGKAAGKKQEDGATEVNDFM